MEEISLNHPGVAPVIVIAMVGYGMAIELRRLAACSKSWNRVIDETVRFTILQYKSHVFRLVTKCAWCSLIPRKDGDMLRISEGSDLDPEDVRSRLRSPGVMTNPWSHILMILRETYRGQSTTLSKLRLNLCWIERNCGDMETVKLVGYCQESLYTWNFRLVGKVQTLEYVDLSPVKAYPREKFARETDGVLTRVRVSRHEFDSDVEYEGCIDSLPHDLVVTCPKCSDAFTVESITAARGKCFKCKRNESFGLVGDRVSIFFEEID
jgi:hypothetical protein